MSQQRNSFGQFLARFAGGSAFAEEGITTVNRRVGYGFSG